MALIWTVISGFVNEKRSGSVTLHFAEGRFASSEEKVVRRF